MDASGKILTVSEEDPKFSINEGQAFIRKGIVGDWKNYFNAEQNATTDKLFAELQAKCPGLEFSFE